MTKIVIVIVVAVAIILLAPFLITLVWQWVVPDIFSGAVAQNIIPASISYWQAWKLTILLAFLGLTTRSRK